MKRIYILMQYYESDFDYAYDVPSASPCFAYESKETAEQGKKMFEKMNNADENGIWYEDDEIRSYYVIEETEMVEDAHTRVEDPAGVL